MESPQVPKRYSRGKSGEYSFHITFAPNSINYSTSDTHQQVFFDETIKELLIVKNLGSKHEITREIVGEDKKEPITFSLPNQGPILDIKFSTDCKFLGIKRKEDTIQIWNLADNSNINFCSKKNSVILGYYWTNSTNLLIITNIGIELYFFKTSSQLKLVKENKMPINWFVYSPSIRILIVSTGPRTSVLQGFHYMLKRNNVMRLPKFDVQSKGIEKVEPSDIVVGQIYSGLYCMYINKKKNELVLYQLSKEIVQEKMTIYLHTPGQVAVSFIDNLIITHNLDQQISMIFDIQLKDNTYDTKLDFPVGAPLPLSPYSSTSTSTDFSPEIYKNWTFYTPSYVLSPSTGQAHKLEINLEALVASFSDRVKLMDFLLRRKGSKELVIRTLKSAIIEKDSLTVLGKIFEMLSKSLASHISELSRSPNKTTDPNSHNIDHGKNGSSNDSSALNTHSRDFTKRKTDSFWKTFVDNYTVGKDRTKTTNVEAVEHKSNTPLPNNTAPMKSSTEPKLDTLKGNQMPGLRVGKSGLRKAVTQTKDTRSDGVLVFEQEELYIHILLPIEEEKAVDYKYLVAAVVEYIRCLNFQHITVKPFLYEIVIDLLVRNNRYYQLHQFLQYHVISDSLHVACQLLSLEKEYPPAYQLALDMLKRLSPDQIFEVLLTKGQVIPAVRLLQSAKDPPSISPKRFLEAAKNAEDPTVFFTVYQYFKRPEDNSWREYTPEFEKKYLKIEEEEHST